MNSLQVSFTNEIAPKLMTELSIGNRMAVPKLVKIVINCGLGEALKDKKVLDKVRDQLAVLSLIHI